mgnify:CR=1 FL=1
MPEKCIKIRQFGLIAVFRQLDSGTHLDLADNLAQTGIVGLCRITRQGVLQLLQVVNRQAPGEKTAPDRFKLFEQFLPFLCRVTIPAPGLFVPIYSLQRDQRLN